MSGLVREEPDRIMVLADIKDILTASQPLGQYSYSPFIRQGTPFQQQVWEYISKIPFGSTETYGGLATKIGNKNLARAVGRACNANPLALHIPCHRVVGTNGIGGFGGGIAVKRKLLEFESRQISDNRQKSHEADHPPT
ncbi:MAG: methylated-DNA--[protein]-cysteine S-methyltransferase [Desulfobulbaceae bacterium]|nr:methylated-DNA--[protein]-cysteine S-methyltransferase [Desulfobulbaceae bacterium]